MAEKKYTGTVTDSKTGETLPGTSVYVSNSAGIITAARNGTIADSNGKYSLRADIQPNEYVTFHMLGYKAQTLKPGDEDLDASLDPTSFNLGGVTITAEKSKTVSEAKFPLIGLIILGGILVTVLIAMHTSTE